MNKSIIWITSVLIFVIAISGCTSPNITPSGDKFYHGNDVSFNYPPEYEIKEVNNDSGLFLVGKSNLDPNCTLQIYKRGLNSSDKINGVSLEDLKNSKRLTIDGFTVEEVENTTIDNTNGLDIIYAHYDKPYVKYEDIVFKKNNKKYVLQFEYNGIGVTDTRATLLITSSFKVLS